jgi:phage gp29-like protein
MAIAQGADLNASTVDLTAVAQEVARRIRERMEHSASAERLEQAKVPVPHFATFQGFANTLARTYFPTDEAIRVAWENSRFMRNDLAVMECVEMRRRSVALLDWRVVPDNPKNKDQADAARIAEKIIKKTPYFLQMRENLLSAVWYGKYGVQLQWGQTVVEGSPYFYIQNWVPVSGDKIVYKVLQGEPYETETVGIRIGYGTDGIDKKYRNQIQATDKGNAYFLTPEQRARFIVHRHMVEDGDYQDPYSGGSIYGVGIRSRIYWTWYLMKETLAWLMEYVERSATGFEIWYYPAGNDQARKAIAEAAENRHGHSGNIVLVPQLEGQNGMPSYQMQRIEPSMSGADTCMQIIKEFFQHQIKRYILGQTLTTEAGQTGLGSNLATIHLETYLQIIKYDALNLEETLTAQLVERVREFNFPRLEQGALSFHLETDEIDHDDRLRSIRTLFDMGAAISEEQAFSAAGMTPPKKDEPQLVNPAFQQQTMTAGLGLGIGGGAMNMKKGEPPYTGEEEFDAQEPEQGASTITEQDYAEQLQ